MQDDLEKFEAGLQQLPPAAAPPELMERLRAATAELRAPARPSPRRRFRWGELFAGWRGLTIGASAAAAVVVLAWVALRPTGAKPGSLAAIGDTVQVGHVLLASFDTVAQLPDGEPVRFHCREWQDDVVIHDGATGVVITKSTPRVEVVPIKFETY